MLAKSDTGRNVHWVPLPRAVSPMSWLDKASNGVHSILHKLFPLAIGAKRATIESEKR